MSIIDNIAPRVWRSKLENFAMYRGDAQLEEQFEYLGSKKIDDKVTAHVLKVKYPSATSVLVDSKDGVPLAAVSFLPRNNSGNSRTLFIDRSVEASRSTFVQGIANVDNEEIKFALANLCESGHLAVEVKKVSASGEVDHLPINRINVIRARSSTVVESDQGEEDKTLVLSGITEKMDDGGERKVSVREEEKKDAAQQKMTRFQVNIEPEQSNSKMCERVKEAKWVCGLEYVIFEEVPRVPESAGFGGTLSSVCSGGGFTFGGAATAAAHAHSNGLVSRNVMSEDELSCLSADTALSTQAAQIVSGSQRVRHEGTSVALAFSESSQAPVFGMALSVWLDMPMLREQSDAKIEADALEEMSLFEDKKNKRLIELIKKVFLSDECAVCMEHEPTKVFAVCGHACVCDECASAAGVITKCYMCRATVSAVINKSSPALSAAF